MSMSNIKLRSRDLERPREDIESILINNEKASDFQFPDRVAFNFRPQRKHEQGELKDERDPQDL